MSVEEASRRFAHRTAWGMVWAFLSAGSSKLISLVGLAILARFIAPEEFGLLMFGMLFVTYAETIGDLGTGAALIYLPSRRQEAAQVAFVVNVVTGWGWFALAWLLAPAVGGFFHSPLATPILRTLAWSFPLKALGNTHDALARKEMRFRARLLPETGMALVKALVAIGLAQLGFGVWSLVWGQLIGLGVWTSLLWLIVDWRPERAFPRELVKPMLSYGRAIVAVNVLAVVVHHVDFIIVGRMLGAGALGLYQMAHKLPEATIALVVWGASRVLFPAFSHVQRGQAVLRDSYLAVLRYVSLLTVPAAVGFVMLAEPMVLTLFGEAWRGSIPILRALGVAAGLRSLGSHAGDVLKATGRPRLLAGLALLKAALLIPVLILAAQASAFRVAAALAGVTAVTAAISIGVVCCLIKIRLQDVGRALESSLLGAGVLAVFLAAWQRVLPAPTGDAGGTLASILLGAATYLAFLRFWSPEVYRQALSSLAGDGSAPRVSSRHSTATGMPAQPRPSPPAAPVDEERFTRHLTRWLPGWNGVGAPAREVAPRRLTQILSGRPAPLGELGRYVLPAGDKGLVRYLLGQLVVPHGFREWLWQSLLQKSLWCGGDRYLLPRYWDARPPDRTGHAGFGPGKTSEPAIGFPVAHELRGLVPFVSSLLGEEGQGVLDANPLEGGFRWILLRDYPGSQRQRLVVFLFAAGDRTPRAILKIRQGTAGRKLASEWDALRWLAKHLSPELRNTAPRPLGYRRSGSTEAMLLGSLPGRSMDFELGRRPARESLVAGHFQSAATWLARFQRATPSAGRTFDMERELSAVREALSRHASGCDPRGWLGELKGSASEASLRLCAGHGDFWARNVLIQCNGGKGSPLGPRLAGVVDWEQFATEAPPFEDLYHFALSYGLNYAWSPYRTCSAEEAFRAAFLEDNRLSRSIRAYFQLYCAGSGLSPELLRPLFHLFLLRRWVTALRKAEAGAARAERTGLWLKLHDELSRAEAPAFPGR
ncbi:MAG: oligosaccharide flippase family protein [Acidobacteriota bacterium]